MDMATLKIKGTRPLLMHNDRSVDPLDKYNKLKAPYQAKRKKTEDDNAYIWKIDFLSAIYYEDECGVHMPGANIFASLVQGGKITKDGPNVVRAVQVSDLAVPLEYDGPATPDELYGDGTTQFVDRRTVGITTNKIMRIRPIFRDWALTARVLVDTDNVLDRSRFEAIAKTTGEMVGLGDYRKLYGRFDVKVSWK